MIRVLLLIAAPLLSTACIPQNTAADSGNETSNRRPVQIIVGFSEPEFDYRHPAFLETLSKQLAAEITLLRPLSGNAALYLCQPRDSMDTFLTRLKNLPAHSDIEYAELDQKRVPQSKPYRTD